MEHCGLSKHADQGAKTVTRKKSGKSRKWGRQNTISKKRKFVNAFLNLICTKALKITASGFMMSGIF